MVETVGVVGLGLIGGSMAKAIHQYTDCTLLGYDLDGAVLSRALDEGVLAAALTPDRLAECDLVIIALYPEATVEYVTRNRDRFRKGGLVMDCGGVKGVVCGPLEAVVQDAGFRFVGGHPMAGRERGGFTSSSEDLYVGASMILTPDKRTDMKLLETLQAFFLDVGFAKLTFSQPEEHDRIIAFTSQLAHIVSSAYVKSPEAQRRRGFSAGSFKDMTRVARLDEDMWTELFLDDADFLTRELEVLIGHLEEYQSALKDRDARRLHDLLKEGRELKAAAGGN